MKNRFDIVFIFLFILLSLLNGCLRDNLNPNFKSMESFKKAIKICPVDLNSALEFCSESGNLNGDCLSEVALKSNVPFNQKISICENISHAGWRSHCLRKLGEEKFNENLSLALETCAKSLLFDINCYLHLGYYLGTLNNISFAVDFCNNLSLRMKHYCFIGLGSYLGEFYGTNLTSFLDFCKYFPKQFESHCFDGLGWGLTRHFGSVIDIIPLCNSIPYDFRKNCFSTYSKMLSRNPSYIDFNQLLSNCELVPSNWRDDCLRGVIFEIGSKYSGDLDKGIEVCNNLPANTKRICFQYLGRALSRRLLGNSSLIVSSCSRFPSDYPKECINGFGIYLYERYFENFTQANLICNQLPLNFRVSCLKGLNQSGFISGN